MSAFREAVKRLLEDDLSCPKCPAENRRGAKYPIEIDQTSTRAFCSSCTSEGPLELFQPPKKET